jgi:PAS domain-containing protein
MAGYVSPSLTGRAKGRAVMIPIDRQKRTGVWSSLLDLQKQVDTSKGLLVVIWFIRFAALLGLCAYFVVYRSNYNEQILSQIRIALLAFFVYVVAMGAVGTYRLEWFLLHWVKLTQVVIELGLYSVFYYLTQDPRSEVYFLYFLPLFVAVRYLRTVWALFVLALACLGLYVAIYFAAVSSNGYSVAEIYVYRALFMICMTLFYALRRRSSVLEDVKTESSHLISILSTLDDGVYVVDNEGKLLFANDVLQAKHGPYAVGQRCSSYFLCKGNLSALCPTSRNKQARETLTSRM